MFYNEKFNAAAGNMRQTWKLIGSVLNSSKASNQADFFAVNNTVINTNDDIVDKFNDYFVNIGS